MAGSGSEVTNVGIRPSRCYGSEPFLSNRGGVFRGRGGPDALARNIVRVCMWFGHDRVGCKGELFGVVVFPLTSFHGDDWEARKAFFFLRPRIPDKQAPHCFFLVRPHLPWNIYRVGRKTHGAGTRATIWVRLFRNILEQASSHI